MNAILCAGWFVGSLITSNLVALDCGLAHTHSTMRNTSPALDGQLHTER